MARAANKTKPATKTAKAAATPKKLGRPPGSKNNVQPPSDRPRSVMSRPPAKRASAKVAAPVVPKMSKADLEAQIVKLERGMARLRKQNIELKLLAEDATARADEAARTKPSAKAETRPAPKAAAKPAAKALAKGGAKKKPTTRRSKVAAMEQEETASNEADTDEPAATNADDV